MAFDALARRASPHPPPTKMSIHVDARSNIPGPPGLPLIGNILDIQGEVPIFAIEKLTDIYGPIIKLNLLGKERIVVADVDLLEQVCDEKRFWKTPGDGAASLSKSDKGSSGLFTAPSEDDMDWQQAHRTLMPAFGPISINGMFDEMVCYSCPGEARS